MPQIPMRFLSKMGTHKIQAQGVTMTVKVVDCAALVATGLSELRSLIGRTTAVGLMVNHQPKHILDFRPKMLQLCVGTRCLLILLYHLDSIPQCLKDFLADKEICFVGGVGMSKGLSDLKFFCGIDCKNGIELSELAARILKKPHLCGVGMATLVGVSLEDESPSLDKFDWCAEFFSDQQIKYAIQGVYASHLIGTKLLGML